MEMDEAGRKRGHKIERVGGATRKKRDPVAEEWAKKQMAEERRREEEESERSMVEFVAKYPNEQDWSDMSAVDARLYRDHWEGVWADLFGSFEDTSQ